MVADDSFARVDTLEQKRLIYERVGPQRAEKYFDQLKSFLSLKLSKVEFDRSCIQTIGRENLSVHNRLIRSILHNACYAKTVPRKAQKVEHVRSGCQRSYLQSLYGDALPQSPRKCRSPLSRDRKLRDRPSPLGPLGKSPSLTCEETVSRLQEQYNAAELGSLSSRPPMVEEGEEVEQSAANVIPSSRMWDSITAPLGVSVNTGVDRRGFQSCSSSHSFDETCQSRGELPDTRSLCRRLQKKLAMERVGISIDVSDVLNKSLDMYLKRIISGYVGIAKSRRGDPFSVQRDSNGQMISHFDGTLPGKYAEIPVQQNNASMLDFLVAMEANPSILGGDWRTQLEKIYSCALR